MTDEQAANGGKVNMLSIEKLPEGGYVVYGAYSYLRGEMHPKLFAATTIEEALKFAKKKLA